MSLYFGGNRQLGIGILIFRAPCGDDADVVDRGASAHPQAGSASSGDFTFGVPCFFAAKARLGNGLMFF
ncbi:hypothetical protein M8494_09385 [Serratia ureilytica]